MDIKNLAKSKDYYDQIILLDAQIIEIEKRAQALAENGLDTGFAMSFPVENNKDNPIGHDGSIKNTQNLERGERGFLFDWMAPYYETHPPKKAEEILAFKLSDVEALSVLGTILSIKLQRRRILINQLVDLGFKL